MSSYTMTTPGMDSGGRAVRTDETRSTNLVPPEGHAPRTRYRSFRSPPHGPIVFLHLCLIAFGLSGCGALWPGARLSDPERPGAVAHVDGIAATNRTGADSPQLRVLVIHGIGADGCTGYSRQMLKGVVRDLGLTPSDVALRRGHGLLRNEDGVCAEHGSASSGIIVTEFDYLRTAEEAAHSDAVALRVYEVFYRHVHEPRQRELRRLDGEILTGSGLLNRRVKNQLITSGIGDALAYLGPFGDELRRVITETICRMMTEPLAEVASLRYGFDPVRDCGTEALPQGAVSVFAIGHSLGGTALLESVVGVRKPSDRAVGEAEVRAMEEFLRRVGTVYLLANQSALIDCQRTGCELPGEKGLWESLYQDHPRFRVAAFSGRNDPLAYPIPPGRCAANQCVNVALHVSNWRIPFTIGGPISAHNGYADHPFIVRCIARGCGRRSDPAID